MKIALKYYAQYDKYSCGCICVKMLLERLGIVKEREYLIKKLWAQPQVWIEIEDIIHYFQELHLEIIQKQNTTIEELLLYLESWYPVLVNYINPLINYGHFWIITGYSQEESVFYIADPRTGQDYGMNFNDFKKNWKNRPENKDNVIQWWAIIWRERIMLHP